MKNNIIIFSITLIVSVVHTDCLGQNRTQKYEGPKYILIDEIKSKYEIQQYTLNTMELYGVDETIELYNIDSRYGLVLMSVLPHFYSNSNWKPIDLEAVKSNVLDIEKFNLLISDMFNTKDTEKTKTMEILLVKSENGSYWASNICLTECFHVVDFPSEFNTPDGFLNIGQTPITMKFMKDSIYPKVKLWWESFPANEGGFIPYVAYIQRAYLSKIFDKNEERYYQFWTFADWRVIDGYNSHRGIDRFVYSPQKGIVAGSFDFYFVQNHFYTRLPANRDRNTKSEKELQQNALEEKVMWAEELKDTIR